jgi:hypothetical protein
MENAGFMVLNTEVMNSSILWDIKLHSLFNVNRFFGATRRLHLQGYSSTLKEATCSSETSVDFKRIIRCYIPQIEPVMKNDLLSLSLLNGDFMICICYRPMFLKL